MPILPEKDKKKALQAQKEKILRDIQYYEKRIEDFCAKTSTNTYYENSSDSEDDFPITINDDRPIPELMMQQSELQTCLQATQELTSLQVLQSEVNVMVEDPVIEREPPVKEQGAWREVTAECRIDLVPFSIMFYVHQGNGLFAPRSYRGLKVLPVKMAHEVELARSVLPGTSRPSDAIEVLRSYAAAYRSRRTTLAKLADKYANSLFMEPMAEGGYILKCANLLEVSWRLENKWSPVAAFHHRMKFDLEYMDENYIKIITQAHKQLSDPSIETDERTLLLAKIISTCLEAQGPTQELYESMESDPESVKKLEKRRTTLDQDTDAPMPKKKREGQSKAARDNEIDDQIMAPPKSLPKKVKPKGKENLDQNRKSVKRSNVEEPVSNVKKAKTDTNDARQSGRDGNEPGRDRNEDETDRNEVGSSRSRAKNDNRDKNEVKTVDNNKPKAKSGSNVKNTEKETVKSIDKTKEVKKSNNNEDTNRLQNNDTDKSQKQKDKPENAMEKDIQKKKTAEGQKVVNKDKIAASSKNDPKSKETDIEKVSNKETTLASSKNIARTESSKPVKVQSKEKMLASSNINPKMKESEVKNIASLKNDPKTNSNTKMNENKTKNAGTKKLTDNDNHRDMPIKKLVKDSKKDKTKNQEVIKNINDNDKNSKNNDVRNGKNVSKNNTYDVDTNRKPEHTKPSIQKTKDQPKANSENAINKDNLPKNSRPGVANTKKATKNEENTENLPKNSESQNPNKQRPKNIANTKTTQNYNAKEIQVATNKPKNSHKNIAIEKKIVSTTQKDETVEKAQVKNVAIKTKEHLADRYHGQEVATTKKNTPKIGEKGKNKMAITNLSHKNPSAAHKLPKSMTGNINKVASNTVKNNKTGNVKENDSATKKSRIPQKKLSLTLDNGFKKNPLRISPRKFPSTFKSASDSKNKFMKGATNIPRLMRKPDHKLK